MQVDAFTDHRLGGNPCAILFDTDDLDTATMQAIARENNLSETSFVMFSVRIFGGSGLQPLPWGKNTVEPLPIPVEPLP